MVKPRLNHDFDQEHSLPWTHFAGVMPHENKFPGRAHAKNKLSVQTKFDSTPPPSNQIVVPLHCVQSPKSITDKLSIARCAIYN